MKPCLLLVLATIASGAQDFAQRGFLDFAAIAFPQAAPNDRGRAVSEALFRYEASYKLGPRLRLSGGFDARTDAHQQVERRLHLSLLDRERQRPAFALRRLSILYSRGRLTLEAGKQFIRWGRTDIVTPTDRFAPQDYLNVIEPDLLAVTAARATYGTQANSIDLVYSPRLTPTRIPLLNQRWAVLPSDVSIRELAPELPNGPQWGARYNHVGAVEYSVSAYQGYDYFPLVHIRPAPFQAALDLQRFYPSMRMFGGDVAVPLNALTFKGEAAYFTSSNPQTDHYIVYVAQLERQFGDLFLVMGYAGQTVTEQHFDTGFSELRGFTKAILGRAAYTIDVNRSLAFEAAVRRMLYVEFTHSQSFESFARCHMHAFTALGGVAREIAYDNLATAVAEHDGRLVRFLPRFLGFAREYGFFPHACNPASGWEKD
ncbi:MAG: hypothetical protein C5B51_03830 [Terriglobia bacterium]|nr:MAG: hypothetical protein C5B51_03830 [Terriglobia bacterium]